jgi:hypothetical protein
MAQRVQCQIPPRTQRYDPVPSLFASPSTELRGLGTGVFPDATSPTVGVYGLDIYSLYRSAEAVLEYLDKTDTQLAELARKRYGT